MGEGRVAGLPPGVFVLERGWLSSNNVVICGESTAAVVDSGYCTHAEQTVALVDGLVGPRALTLLVNTHLHSDHCGGNSALQRHHRDLETRIPPGLASAVQQWDTTALTYEPTGQSCPRFRMDTVVQPGTSVLLGDLSWHVHAAPGHDPNSIILFEPTSRTLISADALWQNGFGVVFQELEGDRAFDEVSDTLDLIEGLRPVTVIPGHGSVFRDLGAALARARSRLDAYVASPHKHAGHAAKVLLKFKLLEVQRIAEAELYAWAARTPYFTLVHSRWFAGVDFEEWLAASMEDLLRSNAAARIGCEIVNA
jgi:glyoxylase-like metal-dependent hydrolase (beta-lactamase superfamily II)